MLWRLKTLKHPACSSASGCLHVLSPQVCDTLGHPIAILRLAEINVSAETLKSDIIDSLERMRVTLRELNTAADRDSSEPPKICMEPVLQFILVVDVDDVQMKTLVSLHPTHPFAMRSRPEHATPTCLPFFPGLSMVRLMLVLFFCASPAYRFGLMVHA